jgi:hypothetical protein
MQELSVNHRDLAGDESQAPMDHARDVGGDGRGWRGQLDAEVVQAGPDRVVVHPGILACGEGR